MPATAPLRWWPSLWTTRASLAPGQGCRHHPTGPRFRLLDTEPPEHSPAKGKRSVQAGEFLLQPRSQRTSRILPLSWSGHTRSAFTALQLRCPSLFFHCPLLLLSPCGQLTGTPVTLIQEVWEPSVCDTHCIWRLTWAKQAAPAGLESSIRHSCPDASWEAQTPHQCVWFPVWTLPPVSASCSGARSPWVAAGEG